MTDETQEPKEEQSQQEPQQEPQPQAAPPPEQPQPAAPAAGGDAEEGKAFSIISYLLNIIFIPFFAVPLIMRNNAFALYHAKQCLIVWLLGMVAAVINVIPCLGQIVWVVVWIFCIVVNIIGTVSVTKLEQKPLPLIGKLAEQWFKGITKV